MLGINNHSGGKMRNLIYSFCLLTGVAGSATAQVSVNIGIGLPSINIGINVPAYPQRVRMPDYPV